MRKLVIACVLAAALVGCGDDGNEAGAPPLGDGTIRTVKLLTSGDGFDESVDAAVSPDGKDVYFTATSPQGPGVFHVPSAGGAPRAIFTGAPFVKPVGIATDGTRAYVADTTASAVFSVPLDGGRPGVVPGTGGTAPRGLEVVREGADETLYFTGRDGVFKIIATGGAAAVPVFTGDPLLSPDAVTVTKSGTVYVTDRGPAGGTGGVFRISGSAATKVADFRPPVLAGVALTLDESLLLVSALSESGTDEVLLVDLAHSRTGTFSKVIGENRAGGGLHRARDADVFAWADVQRPGRVYRIEP